MQARIQSGENPYYASKEIHFFDVDTRYARGLEFYEKHLPEPGSKKQVRN